MTYPNDILEKMVEAYLNLDISDEPDLSNHVLMKKAMAAALKAIGLEWRPIEEAPRESYGNKIIVLCGNNVHAVSWHNAEDTEAGCDGWFVDNNKDTYPLRKERPTHFLDLAPLLALKGGE